jgi:hypothetical protein
MKNGPFAGTVAKLPTQNSNFFTGVWYFNAGGCRLSAGGETSRSAGLGMAIYVR